jgi:hypothetical protein
MRRLFDAILGPDACFKRMRMTAHKTALWGAFLLSFSSLGLTPLLCPGAQAYETDAFTQRNLNLKDSLPLLDQRTNDLLERIALSSHGPDRQKMFNALRHNLITFEKGAFLASWLLHNDEIEKVSLPYKETIYGNAKGIRFPGTEINGFFDPHVISPSIVLGGEYIGLDKIGHFFAVGFDYFDTSQKAYAQGDDGLWAALRRGDNQERGFYGLRMSKVYSYGDLSANAAGYRFWNSTLWGDNPYFKFDAIQNRFVKVREFTWKEYVSAAWDEGTNCSRYEDKIADRMKQHLKDLGFSCPIDPKRCEGLAKVPLSRFTLSPECYKIAFGKTLGESLRSD